MYCLGRFSSLMAIACVLSGLSSIGYADDNVKEIWFGWLEAPNQHLRLFINTERNGEQWKGTIESPDQAALKLPLSDLSIDASQQIKFNVENPATPGSKASFTGSRKDDQSIEGTFSQGGTSLPLKLAKIEPNMVETADISSVAMVWVGNLNAVTQKLDVRLRIYSDPPYATKDTPHLVFDIPTQKLFGIPVKLDVISDEKAVFDIPAMQARFEGKFKDDDFELQGNFIKGAIPLPLTLKLLNPPVMIVADPKPGETIPTPATSEPAPTKPVEPAAPAEKPASETKVMTPTPAESTKPTESSKSTESSAESKSVASNSKFFEESFAVTSVKKHVSKRPEFQVDGVSLSGTITWPILKSDSQRVENRSSLSMPAVIMVTSDGPQDRDNSIGHHKPFEKLANFLAERGIASLRYDDRGTGKSTGRFDTATTQNFIDDAHAIFKHALTVKGINPQRIGFLGHGEGANISVTIAGWESQTAFLILLAPAGQRGAVIRSQQVERILESQNLPEDVRETTLDVQRELQQIAIENETESPDLRDRVRSIVTNHWDLLRRLAVDESNTDPTVEESIKDQMIANLERQVKSLGSPWMRYYLQFDPRASWLLIRCPTLAVWGEKDTEVIPLKNQTALLECIERNQSINVEFDVLTDLNHLFQKAETGRADEYDQIEETLSSNLLHRIERWLTEQDLSSVLRVSK